MALGCAVDDAGTKWLLQKCRISNMPVSIGVSEYAGNRIWALFLPLQYSCYLYVGGLERSKSDPRKPRCYDAIAVICGPILYPRTRRVLLGLDSMPVPIPPPGLYRYHYRQGLGGAG